VLTYNDFDFGYTWPWTYGHLIVAVCLAGLFCLLRKRLPVWASVILAGLSLWALAGFLIVQFVLGYNSPMTMPLPAFMSSAEGEVLDIGCGSGRTTIMVASARPRIKVASLDNFSADYIKGNGEALLRRNLKVAGVGDSRVRVLRADMRQIPAADGEFDGVVSSYAIDHLNRAGIRKTLGEVNRVLKPGGEFLLMVVNGDAWLKTVYGPLFAHSGFASRDFWPRALEEAGFHVVDRNYTPGSANFLCRKP